MKKESVYLDTSVPSAYYDERELSKMEITRQWWDKELKKYDVFVSVITIAELMKTKNLHRREELVKLVKPFIKLEITPEIEKLSDAYVKQRIVSKKYLRLNFL